MQDGSGGATAPEADWDEDFDRSTGFPLTATALAVVPVIAAGAALSALEANPLQTLARALGSALIVALIAWGIAYVFTIRRSSAAWKIGSLLILILAATLGGLGAVGYKYSVLQRDFATLAEMRFTPGGNFSAPPGAEERGPMSRLLLEYFRGMAIENAAMKTRLEVLGFNRLGDPVALNRDPAMLKDCDRLLDARAASSKLFNAAKARTAELRRRIMTLDIPTAMRADIAGRLLKSREAGTFDTRHRLLDAQIDAHRGLCQVLARRRWEPQRGMFAFTDAGDASRFVEHANRALRLQREAERLEAAHLETLRHSQLQLDEQLR